MKLGSGRILEIRQDQNGQHRAIIQMNGVTPPKPGQYLQAHRVIDRNLPVGNTIFPSEILDHPLPDDQFLTTTGIPNRWQPGDHLEIRGALGTGFVIPEETIRLALCALGGVSDHLLPLAGKILTNGGEVALITEGDFSRLPARIEIRKLDGLPEILRWADFAACAIPIEESIKYLDLLRANSPLACPTQVLIYGHFPCSSMADCGICAIRTKRGQTVSVCQDGPVFDWQEIS